MEKSMQVKDFDAVLVTEVKSGGRVSGLSRYVGKKCIVIVENG